MAIQTQIIRVNGVVQGVGFRPFVWHLAQELQLTGWVGNDASGVVIHVQGTPDHLDKLRQRLRTEAPPLARVDAIHAEVIDAGPFVGFSISDSQTGVANTMIGPDVSVCDDCVQELFSEGDRRYCYPFITCTHCGPRFTVTRHLPYDRPQTSMSAFLLCPQCATEYASPPDRRFHAQTTCCPACGPRLTLSNMQGEPMEGDCIAQTVKLLQAGAIIAIKGLGGFHLACNARDAGAVARLRRAKNREAKPFAVMVANVQSLHAFASVSTTERELLESQERPVVLLNTLATTGIEPHFPGVADGLSTVGAMLPVTPIHYLLWHEAAGRPPGMQWLRAAQDMVLVMTSANPGGEPLVRVRSEALVRLANIADYLLDHDRDIVARCDDSVVQANGTHWHFIRRSRGYAPNAIALPRGGPSVLAFGSHLKNTVCVTRGAEAFLSPHIGSLDNAETCRFQDETVQRMCDLLAVQPVAVAHDLHPDDYSTRAAIVFAQEHGLRAVGVQHHHAHIAAVCAEHGFQGPVLGLALDGVGWGIDGQAWGGELLLVMNGVHSQRFGHLAPLALPGGDKAAREPWRMAASALFALGRKDEIATRLAQPGAEALVAMLERDLQCPRTSSMGRIFDAAAALLGISSCMQYEAQAPVLLAQAAMKGIAKSGWPSHQGSGWQIDNHHVLHLLPVLEGLLDSSDVPLAAARFHATVVAALAQWVMLASEVSGVRTVALGGGCFLNTLLSSKLRLTLEASGLQVLAPSRISPGDGSIALGQAWVAQQILEAGACV
ncbi:MAG TPA: carbamoyltransferase HypF [Rhodoferax sp.]|nr:carbamoyltransferase HypF [Rhodoferax sp.]